MQLSVHSTRLSDLEVNSDTQRKLINGLQDRYRCLVLISVMLGCALVCSLIFQIWGR